MPILHLGRRMGIRLNDFEEKQDEDDDEDEADAAAAVVAESRSHAIAAKAEHQNQNNQKDEHFLLSPFGENSPDEDVMQIWLRL
jgi:hypothetical protein